MSSPWVTLRDLDNGALEWEGPLDELIAANGDDVLDADEHRRVLAGEAVTVHWSVVQRADVRERGLARRPGVRALLDVVVAQASDVALLGRNLGVWRVDAWALVAPGTGPTEGLIASLSRPAGEQATAIAAEITVPRRVVLAGSGMASAKSPHLWVLSIRGRVRLASVGLPVDGRVTATLCVLPPLEPGGGRVRVRRRLITTEAL